MKRTLSLLAISALALGTTLSASVVTIKVIGNPATPRHLFSPKAQLYNTSNSGIVAFDERENTLSLVEAPFDLNQGLIVSNYQLKDLPGASQLGVDVTEVVLDFTNINQYNPIPNWGSYLQSGATYTNLSDVDYLAFTFAVDYTDSYSPKFNLVDWYAELNSPVKITGLFKDDVTATGYLVTETCDTDATAQGGIVFFNDDVAPAVRLAEVLPGSDSVPEPTTATLSLLALAGLAMRRRRSA